MKPTYEKAKKAISEALETGDISPKEAEEKLKLAEKLKTKESKVKAKPIKILPKAIEICKETIAQYNASKKAQKASEVRKELIAKAETLKAKEEIKKLSDTEVLQKATPKPRIDVFSKEKIQGLVMKNLQNRQKILPKTQKVSFTDEQIKEIVSELYAELDKKIDKLLKLK